MSAVNYRPSSGYSVGDRVVVTDGGYEDVPSGSVGTVANRYSDELYEVDVDGRPYGPLTFYDYEILGKVTTEPSVGTLTATVDVRPDLTGFEAALREGIADALETIARDLRSTRP